MADDHARNARFGYKENSNLVLSGGRSGRRVSDDPRQKGEVSSLYNSTGGMRMGDRVPKVEAVAALAQGRKRDATFSDLVEKRDKRRAKKVKAGIAEDQGGDEREAAAAAGAAGLGSGAAAADAAFYDAGAGVPQGSYQPSTQRARDSYNRLTRLVCDPRLLGSSVPRDVIRETTEEIVCEVAAAGGGHSSKNNG